MSRELLTPSNELLVPITARDYARGFDAYIESSENEQVLTARQDSIFQDVRNFIAEGGHKGYVTAPTGSGKTVLFVKLSKALQASEQFSGRKPNILVVEPTKDLVYQTMGRSGEKGYGKFAPELKVMSFFSDSTMEEKHHMSKANVVVTTYQSFSLMKRMQEIRSSTNEEMEVRVREILDEIIDPEVSENKPDLYSQLLNFDDKTRNIDHYKTQRNMLDTFDVYILDEAHNVMGATHSNIVESIGKDKLVIGFTATPDANEKRKLENHLPVKIHDLTFKEAVSLGMLAPITGIGLKSSTKIHGSDIFDNEGDYQEGKLKYVASNRSRNNLIINAAKILVENGFGTVIPCIPGSGSLHAVTIAAELQATGISAEAVHGGIPTSHRNEIYSRFEKGEIDVLTNTKILAEGWDSTRAKAIIEASPTRSLIRKRQRIGRIVRPGDIALVIEIIDEYDKMNPPIHLADILEAKTISPSDIFGEADDLQTAKISKVASQLGLFAVLEDIPSDYTNFEDTLSQYQEIRQGRVAASKNGHFSTPEKLSPMFSGLNDEIILKIHELYNLKPNVVIGRSSYNLRLLFNLQESLELVKKIPESEKDKAYIEDDLRWLSSQGLALGFKNIFPDISKEIIEERLLELDEQIEWRPLKTAQESTIYNSINHYNFYKAYLANDESINLIKKQLDDYFELTANK